MVLAANTSIDDLQAVYEETAQDFDMFYSEVESRCTKDSVVCRSEPPVIYMRKGRIKAWDSLERKIKDSPRQITKDNLLYEISDVAGIRLVVLHPSQLFAIDRVIRKNIEAGRWRFRETPKAYEADQQYVRQLESSGFRVESKESYYTSLHYLVEQASDQRICVEVQARTLFEDLWGEVEHFLRYKPSPEGADPMIDDEMRVLKYIIDTGRAHLDLIFRRRENGN